LTNMQNEIKKSRAKSNRPVPTSTVGRGKAVTLTEIPKQTTWSKSGVQVSLGDSLELYSKWDPPAVIVSDGGYGVLGFEGDTSDHLDLPDWYEPHVREWAKHAKLNTTLWFWNSEIGWAAVHPILEKYGWRYQNANVWNKGIAHIAGNVNTAKIRRFPVVSEVCVQYVFEARINGQPLKEWILREWRRTGLPNRQANEACGVADAATRKYFDQGHLWYWPPVEMFQKLCDWANTKGKEEGRPYFSAGGKRPMTGQEWALTRAKFRCPHGVTNVWDRGPVNGSERMKAPGGKAIHLNQKPLDLMSRIIQASSDPGEVVWEPFGGLFTGTVAAYQAKRKAFSAEIDPTYYTYGLERVRAAVEQGSLNMEGAIKRSRSGFW